VYHFSLHDPLQAENFWGTLNLVFGTGDLFGKEGDARERARQQAQRNLSKGKSPMHLHHVRVPTLSGSVTGAIALAMFSILVSPASARVKEYCSERYVKACLIVDEGPNKAEFFFNSPFTTEITLTVRTDLENLVSNENQPYTKVFTSPGRHRLFKLKRANNSRPWKYDFTYRWRFGSLNAVHDESYIYSLPYTTGSSYKISQGCFGSFSHQIPSQFSIDFKMPEGTPIHAVREGKVVKTRSDAIGGGSDPGLKENSNFINVRHSDGTIGHYGHLKTSGITTKVGEWVRKGQLIGYSGCTGFCSGPHLHFEVHNPTSGYDRQTIPLSFRKNHGIISCPETGKYYEAIH
jgi:murein DD-endopeptidase MepM/ murein hydrolase activator NlpD